MKMNTKIKKKVAEIIRNSNPIAITCHVRPDADCIGSGLALFSILKQLGKDVHFFNIDKSPFPLTELPGYDQIEFRQIYPDPFEIVVLIEGGTEDRTGMNHLDKYYTINIDHHATSSRCCNLNWVAADASAAGELVYELANELSIQWTRDIGFNLYAAVSSDTGSFKYSNTTAKALEMASRLVKKCQFTPVEVSDLLFNSNHLEKVQMIQKVLSTLELRIDNKVAMIAFRQNFLTRLSLNDIETEDVISIARSILGVDVTLFFKEIEENHFRVSIRSRGDICSQEVAKAFNGGGHPHAAGFFFKGNIETAKKEILRVVKKQMK
jgi:bifunctional oligoribonuclease and PAP phosphatase NrnA